MTGSNTPTSRIEELETDGQIDDQTTRWFQGMLLNAILALDEAGHDERLRIKGRMFILRDLFGLSKQETVELADEYEQGDTMAELLELN